MVNGTRMHLYESVCNQTKSIRRIEYSKDIFKAIKSYTAYGGILKSTALRARIIWPLSFGLYLPTFI